jgi:co-chaperonin GroES (HSP10)
MATGLVQKLAHKEDPATVIWLALGNALDEFDIAAQGVLIAMYERPDDVKTEGGILLPHAHVKEDEYQSRVALVVKLGRRAFTDDEHVKWDGYHCEVGDWVALRSSDGMKLSVRGVHCRLISDVYLKLKIPHADAVF